MKAVIISAALSLCCYKWLVSFSVLFLSPLFVLLFSNRRRELLAASGLLLAGELVCFIAESFAVGFFSLRECAYAFFPLAAMVVPLAVFFCLTPLRFRYALMLSSSCSGIILALFVLNTGFLDVFTSFLQECSGLAAESIGVVFDSETPAGAFSAENISGLLLTFIRRMWLFGFVFLNSVNIFAADFFCRWRSKARRPSLFTACFNERWCSVCLIVAAFFCAVLHVAAPQSYPAVAAWNCMLVFAVPAASAGISVFPRTLYRFKPATRMAIIFGFCLVFPLLLAFFGGILYFLAAATGVVDSWYPLYRPPRIFADPTPGDGKENGSSEE